MSRSVGQKGEIKIKKSSSLLQQMKERDGATLPPVD